MTLRETVDKYLDISGDFGRAVPLADFGLTREETERSFGVLDEDYHISRYFHLSNQRRSGTSGALETYQINGFPYTHVSLDAEIATVL